MLVTVPTLRPLIRMRIEGGASHGGAVVPAPILSTLQGAGSSSHACAFAVVWHSWADYLFLCFLFVARLPGSAYVFGKDAHSLEYAVVLGFLKNRISPHPRVGIL